MSDEFDDVSQGGPWVVGPKSRKTPQADSTPRLIGRLYVASDPSLRAKLLASLLRPLGPLGRAGVAAGVFAKFAAPHSVEGLLSAMDEATRFSNQQIAELAGFVQQVSPQALDRFAHLAAANRLGMTAFSIGAAALLLKTLSHQRARTGKVVAPMR